MRRASLPLLSAALAALAVAPSAGARADGPPVALTSPPPPACVLTAPGSAVSVSRARHAQRAAITLVAMCSQFVNATVTGQLTERGRRGRPAKRLTLAPSSSYVPAHTATSFTIKLPASALAALLGGTPESASFTLNAVDEHGSARAGLRLARLKPPPGVALLKPTR